MFRLIFQNPFPAMLALTLALASAPLQAQETPAVPSSPLYRSALDALARGIPEVAIEKLQACLSDGLPDDQRTQVRTRLGDAMIQAGRLEEALKTLAQVRPGNVEGIFLRAEALAGLGRWSESLALYLQLLADPVSDFTPASRLGAARALEAMERDDEAIRILKDYDLNGPGGNAARLTLASLFTATHQLERAAPLLEAFRPATPGEERWKSYVDARILMAQNQMAPAYVGFQAILNDPRGLTDGLLAGIALGMTDCRAALNGLEAADDILEDFLWKHPDSPWLELIFKKLDEVYAAEENPSDSELQRLALAAPPRRAALAHYYLVFAELRQKKRDKALRVVDGFLQNYPAHPLTGKILLMQGKILMADQKDQAALKAFENAMRVAVDPELRAEIEASSGLAYFHQGEYLLAANFFRAVADHSPRFRETALFDSALSWLHQGNYDRFLVDYKELSENYPESAFRQELILEEGLLQARSGDRRAESTLRIFLRDFPEHPRVTEARLALAELAFLSDPPDRAAAGLYLRAAYDVPAGAGEPARKEAAEQADYLAIFMADSAPDRSDPAMIDACRNFIRAWPESTHLQEVRMKLGQIYYRSEDFPDAQTQFETLARENPESPYAETALFLAGESSMKSMNSDGIDRAVEIFEEAAQRNGSLKLYARQEQAVAKSRLGKEKEAIILYDSILSAKPENAELRFTALCGKGNSLLLLGATDPPSVDAAIAVFDQLAADPDVTPVWRNQALYKKGKCLQQQKKDDAALATYYDVVQSQNTTADKEPEYFWYYKAGFDAAAMLESQEKWKSSIAMYQQMARLQGPRAEEAKSRANQLRLEHFIWEE